MSKRSKQSIKFSRTLSRNHKIKSAKNTKYNKYVSLKKTKIDYNKIKKELDNQIDLMEISQKTGNLEVYTYANKIIIILILQLMAHGTKKSINMANKYKEKTGIEINKQKINKQLSKIPTLKNTVEQIYESHNHPQPGSLASGWRW